MIRLYNTLTQKKDVFRPLQKGRVLMYHCGPTVYARAHIGNLRSFITWDILRRAFEYVGFRVSQVMNITDVDDKTIGQAHGNKKALKELTERHLSAFLSDLDTLNVLRPHILPKATEHIDAMIRLIETLIAKKAAYHGEDGSIYFKLSSFKRYGKLARLKNIQLKENTRVERDEYDKQNVHDFVLWRAWNKKEDGDIYWDTPLGRGRPGWHIECSAMSMKHLGEAFDIHTGGRDLIFPHHENEIAQSEKATGKRLARYWLHNEFVQVNGKKMAKSLNNVIALEDIKKRGASPLAFRYLILTAHYRTILNFTWESLKSAEHALARLYARYQELEEGGKTDPAYLKKFTRYMENDLDTPKALSLVWSMLKDKHISPRNKKATLKAFDAVLGLCIDSSEPEPIPQNILTLVETREVARKNKNWREADKLREEIGRLGYIIKDTPEGFLIQKKIN